MRRTPRHNIPIEPKSLAAVGERVAIRIILASLAKFFAAAFRNIGIDEFGYSEADVLRVMKESMAEMIASAEIEARNLGAEIDPLTVQAELRMCAVAYLNAMFAPLGIEPGQKDLA